MEINSKDVKKYLIALFVGLSIGTLSAAAKSYIDVEKLKVEYKNIKEIVIEIRDDVKEIKRGYKNENNY